MQSHCTLIALSLPLHSHSTRIALSWNALPSHCALRSVNRVSDPLGVFIFRDMSSVLHLVCPTHFMTVACTPNPFHLICMQYQFIVCTCISKQFHAMCMHFQSISSHVHVCPCICTSVACIVSPSHGMSVHCPIHVLSFACISKS